MIKYRIQELFDFDKCEKYFIIQKNYMERGWIYADAPRCNTLQVAKELVRIMKEYEQPVYHYVDEDEN